MKKFFVIIAVATLFASCSITKPSAKLTNTSTHSKVQVVQPIVAVLADLDVSPTKISFFFLPSQTVINGGVDNVVNTAVREALLANGNADVLVALEQQIKYNTEGKVESITISGYPAKYTNFRSPGDDYLREISKSAPSSSNNQAGGGGMASLLKGFKLGKK